MGNATHVFFIPRENIHASRVVKSPVRKTNKQTNKQTKTKQKKQKQKNEKQTNKQTNKQKKQGLDGNLPLIYSC